MSVKISYKNSAENKSPNKLVLFVKENFNINPIKKQVSDKEFSYIADLLKTNDLKNFLLVFEVSSKKKNNLNSC